ncbi:hypothetical protein HX005_02115 [Acinetobacter sp. R933-2]|uniref:hypothetical protein n=1 Tax=Acinetobacter sp. R933-2 TaxID=2746728 RepID=UPI002578AF6C|nr:hypothetical protein [Acinetobacter sp. R933-2]MDM1246192.1 hypothetical protein [Acinetobacter sp. R933-2]
MDKIDQFTQIWLDYSLKLHGRQGIDEVLFAEMIQLLKDIDAEYRAKDYIPKKLVEIFVDMFIAIDGSASYYDDEYQQEIYQMADQLSYYARNICTN